MEEYFNEHTPVYELERFRAAFEFMKENAAPGSTCMDIGCGAGNVLEYVKSELSLSVSGMDFAENYVAQASKRCGCEILKGSVLDTAFIDGIDKQYDFVLLGAILHHLVGKTRTSSEELARSAVRNAMKLLKKGGHLIIIENAYSPSFPMDVIFYVKRFMTGFSNKRVSFLNGWNNIGAPVISFYTDEKIRGMIPAEIIKDESIDYPDLSPLWRLAGIKKASWVTYICKKS
jgi:ubiquinone/menaquinone biosynthesis C-methylase UbiE